MNANADANNLIDELNEMNNQESLTLTIINSENEVEQTTENEQKGEAGEQEAKYCQGAQKKPRSQ